MNADLLTILGIVGVLTAASALAVIKSRASMQQRGWIEKIENQRRQDQYPRTGDLDH